MRRLSQALLIVGSMWASLVIWMLCSLAAISDPVSLVAVAGYSGAMLVGPAMMIAGSTLLLRRTALQCGLALVTLGCVSFTVFTFYSTVDGLQHRPLQVLPVYWHYAVLVVVTVLSDLALYGVWRVIARPPAAGR